MMFLKVQHRQLAEKSVLVAAIMIAVCLQSAAVAADATIVTHGPLLGQATSNSVRVWARTNQATTLEFRYGTDPAHLDGVSERIETGASHDFTGWTTLTGLKSDTSYVIRAFLDGNPAGPEASLTTRPLQLLVCDRFLCESKPAARYRTEPANLRHTARTAC